jgi:ribosomal protein L29
MIQKQSGSPARVKRDIARVLTVMKEKGATE